MVISLPSNDVVASFFKDQLMTNNLVIFLPPHHVLATSVLDVRHIVSLFLGRSCGGKSFSEEPPCISDLATWTSEFQVKHNAVEILLKLLQSHGHPQLPSTARTVLKTAKELKTVEKSGMQSLHYSLKEMLFETLNRYPAQLVHDLETLEVSFNVDGLPLFKSSGKSMWPVLCVVLLSPGTIFPSKLTCGMKKPTDLAFLENTVKDLAEILANGLNYRGRNIKVKVRGFVCDAKAMIKNTKCFLRVLWV
ncbi:hypothetical protein UPYG_G00284340 [Umbra pygmaea]|uniref:Uncharacterized protein n=1 Tax=Umbra pygmaea TaxID=75934 RepID=A0ABD0W3Q1_UMBPY